MDYSLKSGWNTEIDQTGFIFWRPRKNEMNVEVDSKLSREEDFANNIEYYLFAPDTLKLKSSKAYDWIKQRYGDKLKLKETK